MTRWDAPNQQVVRADQSGPWQEGTGGSTGGGGEKPAPEPPGEPDEGTEIEQMTKAQLIQLAQERGLPVSHEMTKDEIKQVLTGD